MELFAHRLGEGDIGDVGVDDVLVVRELLDVQADVGRVVAHPSDLPLAAGLVGVLPIPVRIVCDDQVQVPAGVAGGFNSYELDGQRVAVVRVWDD